MRMDGSMVPPEWHRCLHCRTDGPLPTKPRVHKYTRANSKFNLSSTPNQYIHILPLDRKVNKGSHHLHFISKDGRPASAETIHGVVWNYTFTADQKCLCFSSHCKLKLPLPSHLDPGPQWCASSIEHSGNCVWELQCQVIANPKAFIQLPWNIPLEVWSYQVSSCYRGQTQTSEFSDLPTIQPSLPCSAWRETVLNPLHQPIYSV